MMFMLISPRNHYKIHVFSHVFWAPASSQWPQRGPAFAMASASAASASAPELTSGDRSADADVSWMIHGIYILYLYFESIYNYITLYNYLSIYIYKRYIYIYIWCVYVCVYVYVYVYVYFWIFGSLLQFAAALCWSGWILGHCPSLAKSCPRWALYTMYIYIYMYKCIYVIYE